MEPNPEKVNGYPVVHIARFAPDTSEKRNLATVVVDSGKSGPASYIMWDIAWNDGQEIGEPDNGIYDLTSTRAEQRLNERIRQRDSGHKSMRNLAYGRDVTWAHFALIQWRQVPVTGREEFDVFAYSAASVARNFDEFYREENSHIQAAIEGYLCRWTEHHRHPSTRG